MKLLILEGLHGENKGKKMQWRLKRTNLKVGDRVVLDCHDWKVIKVVGEKKKPYQRFGRYIIFDIANWQKPVEPKNYYEIGKKIREEQKQALSELRNRPYFKTIVIEVKGKPSQGEDLEKIKFPCWCSYYSHYLKRRRFGQIVLGYCGSFFYQLQQVEIQKSNTGAGIIETRNSLENLIKDCDIEILKGELHLWREVE